jgi:hypothetical protein
LLRRVLSPYSLVNWWDMERFSAQKFFNLATILEDLTRLEETGTQPLGQQDKDVIDKWFENLRKDCLAIGLKISAVHAQRIIDQVRSGGVTHPKHLQAQLLPELRNRIQDELGDKMFMYIPPERAERYDQKEIFGAEVNAKLPAVQYDAVEAGNCFACGRSTAVVFHLMRIMETGVQALGTKLGVHLTNEKAWQVILDGVNKAIRALPPQR